LRSGTNTMRNPPPAGRCARVRSFVTSDGMGGTDGGTGGRVGTVPLGDGRGRVVAGPGSGSGAVGSDMMPFPWRVGTAAASSATAGLATDRNAATGAGSDAIPASKN
jgi:hypothetical protein